MKQASRSPIQKWNLPAFLILFILCMSGCHKNDDDAPLGPGLFLSCDVPASYWYPLKDFLKEHHIKVTFYMEGFQQFSESDKLMIKEMQADGHEMAHHTATHPNAKAYLSNHTIDDYLRDEIIGMQIQMKKEGLSAETFAYPNGEYTTETDKALLKYFTSLRRTLNPYYSKHLEDVDAIYYRYGNNRILNAASIDQKYQYQLNEIFSALEKAKKSRQTIALYCHEIIFGDNVLGDTGRTTIYSIKESDLKAIIEKANELHLRSYTASEISRKNKND
jgi:hypothetical protein